MELRQVSKDCEGGDCPTVYLTDRGTAVFQGDVVSNPNDRPLMSGEQAVELPLDVVRSAFPALAESV